MLLLSSWYFMSLCHSIWAYCSVFSCWSSLLVCWPLLPTKRWSALFSVCTCFCEFDRSILILTQYTFVFDNKYFLIKILYSTNLKKQTKDFCWFAILHFKFHCSNYKSNFIHLFIYACILMCISVTPSSLRVISNSIPCSPFYFYLNVFTTHEMLQLPHTLLWNLLCMPLRACSSFVLFFHPSHTSLFPPFSRSSVSLSATR